MTLISARLLKKYNIPGPRYTSYPTVPYWETSPTQEQWIEHIKHSLLDGEKNGVGAALYIHIPFCESLCTYCGCNTRITRKHTVGAPYVDTVLKEWELYHEKMKLNRPIQIEELHLGGGTPTFLPPKELSRLVKGILSKAEPMKDRSEFSIEVDPRVTTDAHLEELSRLGFTRISLGVQDFDPKVQEVVNRVQSDELVLKTTESARRFGFTGVNYDLIYGLPFQTQESIRNTIETVQRHRPDRIAFYSYAHVPWIKPSQRRFTEEDLPTGDEKRALYELGRKMLEEAGYREIGMDHFALESDSLWKAFQQSKLHRNFMGYMSRHVSPLIGLGVSAIGDSWTAFSQNEKMLEKYQRRIEAGELPLLRGHILTEEDLLVRKSILNLMTQMETPVSHLDFKSDLSQKLEELIKDDLIHLSDETLEVTEKGRPFLRNICMAFDMRLSRKAPQTQLFSQTV